jgi:hypothetical protein
LPFFLIGEVCFFDGDPVFFFLELFSFMPGVYSYSCWTLPVFCWAWFASSWSAVTSLNVFVVTVGFYSPFGDAFLSLGVFLADVVFLAEPFADADSLAV